ncbi:MAG: HAMP domain-containing sensor histidine kinase, partial [Pseudomonadota bacterium]
IQGNLEILRGGLTPDLRQELQTELDLIEDQTQRINLIVGKLLNFTRPGELSDATSLVDVASVVQDTLVLVAPDLRKHGIEAAITHSPAPTIRIVETELQQVLINLFVNAAQAMAPGGTVDVRTSAVVRDGVNGAQIVVRDTGPGIAAEDLPQVFDPFFTTKPAEGSGLGLSISQTLIARAGGLITAESVLGEGTTFFIWCPEAEPSVS